MIYLILAVLSSVSIAMLMRGSNRYVKDNMVMFAANYTICVLLSAVFLKADGFVIDMGLLNLGQPGLTFAMLFGLFTGIMYLMSFVLLQYNIKKNGVVLASIFMKLGVLVPVLMSVLVFEEVPTAFQVVGFILAILSIIIINANVDSAGKGWSGIWLIILLLAGGFTDSTANIYEKLGRPDFKNHFLLYIFIGATIVSIIGIFAARQKISLYSIIWGILIGVPNYFSARFLLYALMELPAIVTYPVYNIATILLISTIGTLLFKEDMNRRKLLGLGLIIVAIVLLNI